ncbi:hypothetical protein CONLIGDRAFT_667496 [Coniochaeta ligniaria NRRL 30616]|uniref:Extracellular membrane protein CFEM domain-containing protein n=1 Tax=Coniochaeta ligniaria NRRL 30616 TaxID=1408157 RepID=A0A1J7JV66_9PEZI|nr:hypothetical protein CONLIGDRAFT_667496 [Coniochaeta ligniaria NRRL 30616]
MLVRLSIPLAFLVSGIGAVDLRFQGAPAVLPGITGAPLAATVELRLAKRQSTEDFRIPDCATSCLSSAVVSNTNCELFDHSSEPCLGKACGYTNVANDSSLTNLDVLYMLSQDCVTYLRTASTAPTTTTKSTLTASPSTFVATKTESNGSVATVTAIINPTSSSSASGPSSSSYSDLSKGAVAGIAVGATLGGILLVAGIAYLIYRCVSSRKPDGPGVAAAVAIATHQDPGPHSDNKAELHGQGKPISPSTVSATPVSTLSPSAGGVSPNTVNASLMPSSMMTATPSPPPLGHPAGLTQHSSVSWQGLNSQQPQMFQAVPSAQGGFVMVPVPPFPGQAVEIGAPGRDIGPVEVVGESNVRSQHELPTQVYSMGPYEMPAPKGS